MRKIVPDPPQNEPTRSPLEPPLTQAHLHLTCALTVAERLLAVMKDPDEQVVLLTVVHETVAAQNQISYTLNGLVKRPVH